VTGWRALPRPARALIAITVLTAAVTAGVALGGVGAWTRSDTWATLGLALAVVIAERVQIALPYQRQEVTYTITDAVWLGALLLADPGVVVIGTAVGVLVGQALQPWSAVKVAYNVAVCVAGLLAAVLVFGALGAPPPDEPAGWLAAAAAALAYQAVNAALVGGIIATTTGRRLREVAVIPPDVMNWTGGLALGILGALVWQVTPAAMPLLLLPIAVTMLGYRGWIQSARERDLMSRMARDAEAIGTSLGDDLSKRLEVPVDAGAAEGLASTLNMMLSRVEAAVARERRFVREASHELRTPITICRGYLEVLGSAPAPEEIAEAHEVVLDELDRMIRLVEDMRLLARVEDPATLRRADVGLAQLAHDLAARATGLTDGRLRVATVSPDATANVDRQRVTQALVNLVKNAREHTPDGTPIELRVLDRGPAWRFEVADHGGGLPPGWEEEAFRPFVTGERSDGSGLGLAIVAGVAQSHGGRAGVDNRPGEGATFWLQVPR
jgi:signal transduction histidine kinase